MGKSDTVQELARLIGLAVAHSIGYILNPSSIYADKYRKEILNFMSLAAKTRDKEHWNVSDLRLIKAKAIEETNYELSRRDYLDLRKFELIDGEIEKMLRELEL